MFNLFIDYILHLFTGPQCVIIILMCLLVLEWYNSLIESSTSPLEDVLASGQLREVNPQFGVVW